MVPIYAECKPENVIEKLKLKESSKFMEFFPEIEYKQTPTDRAFFYNVVNTLIPHSMEKMKYYSSIKRVEDKEIKDEIEVQPEFRDLFLGEFSLIGR